MADIYVERSLKIFDDDVDSKTEYFESEEFIDYCDKIREALEKNEDLNIREIHDIVGRDKMHWTFDALERLEVDIIKVCPCRFKLRKRKYNYEDYKNDFKLNKNYLFLDSRKVARLYKENRMFDKNRD